MDRERVFGDAAKYYSLENPKGRDIEHVKGVLRNAMRLKGKRLNDLEHATLSWHDVGVQESRPRHGEIGATMLSKKFPEYGFTPEQISQAADAVRYHSKQTRPEEVQNEMMAGKRPLLQLLAEADEGPPMSADEEVADWVRGWADGRSPQPFDSPDEAVAERTMRMLRQKAHDLKAGRLSYSTDRYNRVFKKDIDNFAKGMQYMRMKRVIEAVRRARANALAPGYVKAASKKEDYRSGYGSVESYTKDKTKDHDEIVVRTKDGRRIVVSNNTRIGRRVEPKSGDPIGYHGYVIRGTNVVHKVHQNRRQPGGWLDYVKAT